MGQPDLVATVVNRSVTITDSFIALHQWKGAPDEVKFLRAMHRHKFGVTVTIDVTHGDRQVEFFTAKTPLRSFLRSKLEGREHEMSCELFAEWIGQEMAFNGYSVSEVSVDEDGENAGTVTFETRPRNSGEQTTARRHGGGLLLPGFQTNQPGKEWTEMDNKVVDSMRPKLSELAKEVVIPPNKVQTPQKIKKNPKELETESAELRAKLIACPCGSNVNRNICATCEAIMNRRNEINKELKDLKVEQDANDLSGTHV